MLTLKAFHDLDAGLKRAGTQSCHEKVSDLACLLRSTNHDLRLKTQSAFVQNSEADLAFQEQHCE